MKEVCLFLIAVLALSTSVSAQKSGISIGANALFPLGEWAEVATIGYGASAT